MNQARSIDEPPSQLIDDPFGWMLEQRDSSQALGQQIESARNTNLPERLVELIANGLLGVADGRGEQTDCIKLLVCKSAPIIRGMQRAIAERIDGSSNSNGKDEDGQEATTDNPKASRIDEYFKHLPDVTEFKNHGDSCETRYSGCKVFS